MFNFAIFRPELEDLSNEDEAVAMDLDMHALILSSSTDMNSPEEPLKTAEEVLREIDDIMQVIQLLFSAFFSSKVMTNSTVLFNFSYSVSGNTFHWKVSGFWGFFARHRRSSGEK